jgi:hypothetical protein
LLNFVQRTVFASRIVCALILITGCSTNPSAGTPAPNLTPEAARIALITLATEDPAAFEDFPPDPELLKGLSVRPADDGQFQFGAFTIDTVHMWYSADITWRGGMHNYTGDFVYDAGTWIAKPPELLRFHNPR